jgi:hypothetical protein
VTNIVTGQGKLSAMAYAVNPRVKPLANSSGVASGAITVQTAFGRKYYATLVGNITLTLNNMDEGNIISLWLTQDGTGSRTFTLTAAAGGANIIIGPSTAIASAAGKTSKVVIAKIRGVYMVEIIAQA